MEVFSTTPINVVIGGGAANFVPRDQRGNKIPVEKLSVNYSGVEPACFSWKPNAAGDGYSITAVSLLPPSSSCYFVLELGPLAMLHPVEIDPAVTAING